MDKIYTTQEIIQKFNISKNLIYFYINTNKVGYLTKNPYTFSEEHLNQIVAYRNIKIQNKLKKNRKDGIFCLYCNHPTKFKSNKSFIRNHLNKAHPEITTKIYYDKYLLKNSENICKDCGKEKSFINISKGYHKSCTDAKCRCNSQDFLQKCQKTKFERYGDKYYVNREKAKKTCLKLYGKEEYRNYEKHKKTLIERYGIDNLSKNKNIVQKAHHTKLKNGEFIKSSNRMKEMRFKQFKKELDEFCLNNNYKFLNKTKDGWSFICNKGHTFEINSKMFYSRRTYNKEICTLCNPILESYRSDSEDKIIDFLKFNLKIQEDIITSDISILKGRELDIYLPYQKLALEYNGIFWHSSKYKKQYYHNNKTKDCKKSNIRLFHIWEDWFINKKDVVFSIISDLLNCSKVINGIDCNIKIINHENIIDSFLKQNSINDDFKNCIHYGLYKNDELFAMLSGGYINGNYNIHNFCTLNCVTIKNGLELLIHHIINTVNPANIIYKHDDSIPIDETILFKLNFKKIKSEIYPFYCLTQYNNYKRLLLEHKTKENSIYFHKIFNTTITEYKWENPLNAN
jgi:hypothetical protein